MPENAEISKQETVNEPDNTATIEPQKPQRNPIKRLGCGLLLVLWFILLLTPCAFFYLAANGEIRIWHSDIPEPHSHPRLLIELVSEVDYRGLRFVNSSVVDAADSDDMMCVQTNVSYFLWETIEDNQDVSYCDCYSREAIDSMWSLTETSTEACLP